MHIHITNLCIITLKKSNAHSSQKRLRSAAAQTDRWVLIYIGYTRCVQLYFHPENGDSKFLLNHGAYLIPTRRQIQKDLNLNIHTHNSLDSIKVDECVYFRALNESTTQIVGEQTAPELANKLLKPVSSLLCLYQPTNGPYPKPNQSSPQSNNLQILILKQILQIYFNIVLSFTPNFLKSLLHFRSPNISCINTPCLLRFLHDPTHLIPLHFIMLVIFS